MNIQVGGERPLRGGFDPGATIVDGRPLRDGFDLPIAVDVGFLCLNKALQRAESLVKGDRFASSDSNPYPPLPTAAKKNFPQPIRWGR
ncbi:hypothetical protein D3C74_440480 [compost metagenome]